AGAVPGDARVDERDRILLIDPRRAERVEEELRAVGPAGRRRQRAAARERHRFARGRAERPLRGALEALVAAESRARIDARVLRIEIAGRRLEQPALRGRRLRLELETFDDRIA